MKTLKIFKERVMRAGYVLRWELVGSPAADGTPVKWVMAYTPRGEWIGTPKGAYRLCVVRGIAPELASPTHCVCSVGFSRKDGKWYGWSHRAIFGFRRGSVCKRGNCHYTPRSLGGRGRWTAKTMADARQMALDFAESVS